MGGGETNKNEIGFQFFLLKERLLLGEMIRVKIVN